MQRRKEKRREGPGLSLRRANAYLLGREREGRHQSRQKEPGIRAEHSQKNVMSGKARGCFKKEGS